MCGEFNVRTGELDDFIVDDDIAHIYDIDWYPEDNFNVKRKSRDKEGRINSSGLYLLDMCKTFGIHIANGRSDGDPDGEFTFCTSNGASVVDYVIASTDLFPLIHRLTVDSCDVSDHFPLIMDIQYRLPGTHTTPTGPLGRSFYKYQWSPDKSDRFRELLLDSAAQLHVFDDRLTEGQVNESVEVLEQIVQRAAGDMRRRPWNSQNRATDHSRNNKEWWDDECQQQKRAKYILLNQYRHTRRRDDLEGYIATRTCF